jgi:hypothetical protein
LVTYIEGGTQGEGVREMSVEDIWAEEGEVTGNGEDYIRKSFMIYTRQMLPGW